MENQRAFDRLPNDASLAVQLVSEHWRNFYATPSHLRLGDEGFWDEILPSAIVDSIYVTPEEAQQICVVAKLDAQFQD